MELGLDNKGCRRFLTDLLSDRQNSSFSITDGFLGSADSNVSQCVVVIRSLVDVDLGACVVLDLVDTGAAFTEDTCNSTSWNSEFENFVGLLFKLEGLEQFGFGTSYTLLATLDEDFVRLKGFTGLFAVFPGSPRKCDLDLVFLLEANDIFTVLANQGSMELGGDFEGLRCLVCLQCMSTTCWMSQVRGTNQSLDLRQDAVLGFLDFLLTSCYLSMASVPSHNPCAVTDLEFGLLVNGFLLLGGVLLLLLNRVRNIHSDTKLVSQPVDTDSMRTDNSTDIFPVYLKFCKLKHCARINNKQCGEVRFTYVAADNSILFGILHDPQYFLDSTIDIRADPADHDDILTGRIACLSTDLDQKGLVFANDSGRTSYTRCTGGNIYLLRVESGTVIADHYIMPTFLDRY